MKSIILTALCISMMVNVSAQDRLTYPDLVARLCDLEYLALPPASGETSGNFSSYDRQSQYDEETETYINWDANADGTGFIKHENEGIVVFEKEGPGVIWRVWSALALDGHIKIYVDHHEVPIIDQPFSDFFEQLNEVGIELPEALPGIPSVNLPNLMPTLSRGRNRFIPIPYKEHCKVVLEKGWGMYYHITYSSFSENEVELPDFEGSFSKEDLISLANADRILHNRGFARKEYEEEFLDNSEVELSQESKNWIYEISGTGAISHFNITYDQNEYPEIDDREEMLRNLWLKITWDNEDKEAVLSPLGMFFGTYPDVYLNRTLPIGAMPGYFYSNWYMPFSDGARFELINKGEKSHAVRVSIAHLAMQESNSELLRFHAKWHKGTYKEEVQSHGRKLDWPLLVTEGKGRYCGMTLHIRNEWEEPEEEAANWWYGKFDARTIWWWWGEGDEKFYVDYEKFPSTYGTGSEDYIGYAWSAEPAFALFDGGFASQPYTAIDGNGHTIISRFHLSDNIPFQESFMAVIEKYKDDYWGDSEQDCIKCPNICLYQAVAFWYLQRGKSDKY